MGEKNKPVVDVLFSKIHLFVLSDQTVIERSYAIHYNSRKYDFRTIYDSGIRCNGNTITHVKWIPAKFAVDIQISDTLTARFRIHTIRSRNVAFVTNVPLNQWSEVQEWLANNHKAPVIIRLAELRNALDIVDSFIEQKLYEISPLNPAHFVHAAVHEEEPNSKKLRTFHRASFTGTGTVHNDLSALDLLSLSTNNNSPYTLFFIGKNMAVRGSRNTWGVVIYNHEGMPIFRESGVVREEDGYRVGSFSALVSGLKVAKTIGVKHVECISSNISVINQLNRFKPRRLHNYKKKWDLEVRDLMVSFETIVFKVTETENRNKARQLAVDVSKDNKTIKEIIVH